MPSTVCVQAPAAVALSREARQQLAVAVAAGVSARYLHLADDTLRCGCLGTRSFSLSCEAAEVVPCVQNSSVRTATTMCLPLPCPPPPTHPHLP